MPSAGAFSHRQKVRRSAINTGFSLDPPPASGAGGCIPYQCFKVSAAPAPGRATAGIQPAICAHPLTVASTFQRGRWQCVD